MADLFIYCIANFFEHSLKSLESFFFFFKSTNNIRFRSRLRGVIVIRDSSASCKYWGKCVNAGGIADTYHACIAIHVKSIKLRIRESRSGIKLNL